MSVLCDKKMEYGADMMFCQNERSTDLQNGQCGGINNFIYKNTSLRCTWGRTLKGAVKKPYHVLQ